MSAAEVRTVAVDEIEAWIRAMRVTFMEDPGRPFTDAHRAWWQGEWDQARTRGAFADGRCVATLRTFPTRLTVPAGATGTNEIDADALTQVTVSATHRRRGLLRQMLSASLAEAKDRGEVVSVLRAAEWSIYGRFGYWPATETAHYAVTGGGRATFRSPSSSAQSIDVVPADREEVQPSASPAFEAHRRARAGQIERSDARLGRMSGLYDLPPSFGREPNCVRAVDGDGVTTGYLIWTATDGDFEQSRIDIKLWDLTSADPVTYRALWDYALNIDLVGEIRCEHRPIDEPLRWLLANGRDCQVTKTEDDVWLRILDVPAALSARGYATADRLVLDVIDDDIGGYGQGRFVLDGGPDGAACGPTTETADLTLSQRALAGVYLGGTTMISQVQAGLVDEHTPGAVDRFAAMLRTEVVPWNATPF